MYISLLYTLGSAIFLAASILFHPRLHTQPELYMGSVCGFAAGSLLFTAAGAVDVWAVMRIQAEDSGPWGAAILNLVGSLLWLAGSLAFWPDWGSDGPAIGACTFLAGSVAYIVSSVWSLRVIRMTSLSTRGLDPAGRCLVATLAAYAFGAGAFVVGGMRYLQRDATQASTLWAVGSLMFLAGAGAGLVRSRVLTKDPRPNETSIALG